MKTFMHLLSGLDVMVDQDATGGCFAVVPGLPGCGSQGDTIEEALENLDDAILTVLDVLREDDPGRLQQLCGSITQSNPVKVDDSAWDSTVEIEGMAA